MVPREFLPENISINSLLERQSLKWRKFPPHVIPMWVADMDFPVPACVKQTLENLNTKADYGYALCDGQPPTEILARAFALRMHEKFNWDVDSRAVLVIGDLVQAMFATTLAFTEPGQSAILQTPAYTRKSTDEGLDQEFNSLDAQHEACAAFIASQVGLGWRMVPDRYDDGGISGGTMERPALQRLLQDIRDKKIDVVVVYKIDRLTRSLMDFSRIVEIFDASSASFVSVTQQFNTTTSMGRLTLNVLLSFAQFEREVTAERIRDKIAASRKKGMWMGGRIPFGYCVEDRKLVIDETDAATVRWMFNRVLEGRNVADTIRDVQRSTERMRLTPDQRSAGKLRYLLANPIYIGKVRHKGTLHDGEHATIVREQVFNDVQAILKLGSSRRKSSTNSRDVHLLTGLLFDELGNRLRPTHTTNHGKRYRYYVSPDRNWSVPAAEIEALAISQLQSILSNQATLHDWLQSQNPNLPFEPVRSSAKKLIEQIADARHPDDRLKILGMAFARIELLVNSVRFQIDVAGLLHLMPGHKTDIASDSSEAPYLIVEQPVAVQRRGQQHRIFIESSLRANEPDAGLVALIGRAHSFMNALTDGSHSTIGELAKKLNLHHADISRVLPLAFLAPSITADLLSGKQSPAISVGKLTRGIDLPALWQDQQSVLSI